MSAPLSPFGYPDQDLLFWLKEYIPRKIATLSSQATSDEDAKIISALRRAIKKPSASIDDIDQLTKEIARNNFKSIRDYARPAIDFVRFCTGERAIESIMDISAALVQEDYFASRHFKASSTKKNHYRAVVGFVNYIQKNNTINEAGASYQFGMETMPRSFDAKKIPDTLFPDEFEKYTHFLDNHYQAATVIVTQRNRLALKLLSYLGIRASELVGLTKRSFNSVDKEGYYPVKVTGKGSKERFVYLKASHVDGDLKAWMEVFDEDNAKLFNFSTDWLYIIVRDSLRLAGIQKGKMGPHLLRHSYATYLLSKGVGLAQIQKLLGHESITTTTIYAKVIDREIKDAARVF